MGKLKRYTLFITILIISLLAGACTQEKTQTGAASGAVSLQITQVDTSQFPLVYVYVSAKDQAGNPVPVPVTDIELLEDGSPINAQAIQGMDEVASFTSLLVMDNSGSMNFSNKLDTAKQAASSYIDQMRSADQAGIISFNTKVQTVQEITSDKEALLAGINGIQARDDTAMWDALLTSVEMLNPISGRKAIIVLTDGMDNQSAATPEAILSAIGEGGLSISTIGFGTKPEAGATPDEYEGIDEQTLTNLAEQAGGIYGYVEDPEALQNLYATIRESLQSEVVISYITPQTLRDGVKRSLSVRLAGAWEDHVSGSSSSYNPGGLIPEVPNPSNWVLFFILLGALLILLTIPLIWKNTVTKKKKKKIHIKLLD
ncbi:MAG: VWA domain-containing protein [Anaerolineaceae bacterium]